MAEYLRAEAGDLVRCRGPELVRRGYVWHVLGGVSGGQTSEEDEDEQDTGRDDNELAQRWTTVAELAPLTTSLVGIALQRVVPELVVDHAGKGDAVAEELETSNLGAPDDHGGHNEQHILEYTTERKDQGRSLANLREILAAFL